MLDLLKAHFFRMVREKYLIAGLICMLAITLIYIFCLDLITGGWTHSYPMGPYALSWMSPVCGIGLFVPFYMAKFFGEEFRQGTIRNQITSGHSRLTLYVSAVIAGIIMATAYMLAIFIILCLGLLPFAFSLPFESMGSFFIAFFVMFISYVFMAVLGISFTFMSGSSTKGMCWIIALYVVFTFILVFGFICHNLQYLDSEGFQELISWIFFTQTLNIFASSGNTQIDYPLFWKTLGELLGIAIIVFALGYLGFRKRDIR